MAHQKLDPVEALRTENVRLIALLDAHGIEWRERQLPTERAPDPPSTALSTEGKISLYRRLFRGRTDDVFCKREGVVKSSFQRWRARIGDGAMPRAASAAGERMPEPSRAGFVDLGGLSLPLTASSARLEITLELGSGVTLRLVRG